MAGRPTPVAGTAVATLAFAACLAAAVVYGLTVVDDRIERAWLVSLWVGVGYAVGCGVVYALPRVLLGAGTIFDIASASVATAFVLGSLPFVLVQSAYPAYAFARGRRTAAGLGLFAAATLTAYVLLGVGGETDVLVVYPLTFGPVAALIAVLPVQTARFGDSVRARLAENRS